MKIIDILTEDDSLLLDPLRGAAAELFGKQQKKEDPEKIALDQAMEKYENDPEGLKKWLKTNIDILNWLHTSGPHWLRDMVMQRIQVNK